MGLIIDSSVLIAGERDKFDLAAFFAAHGSEVFFIAAITASELLHGVERANTAERREKRSRYVESVLERIPILDFDLSIARQHAVLWAQLEQARQIIGPHDLQIAATAVAMGHSVATLNHGEFVRVPGLSLVEVQAFVRSGR